MDGRTEEAELGMTGVSVLNVGRARTRHRWGGRDISSPFARIYYVKSGRAVLHLPGGDVETRPGHMYLVPAFMPHSYVCDPGFEFYYMFVHEPQGGRAALSDLYDMPHEVEANEACDLLFTNYCQLYPRLSLPFASAEDFNRHPAYREYARRYSQMSPHERMQLQGLVWIVVSYFVKRAAPRRACADERVARVCRHVREHLRERLTAERLAEVACVTESHLRRLFREALGVSPVQYVIRARVQYAQHQLLTTEKSVQRVAAEAAFDDVSYFIRLFKKHIGFTPQDYRDTLKY